jgi:N-acetylmuramoyl-L-alanine amidase
VKLIRCIDSVRRNGVIEKGRPFDVCGAHVEKYNSVSLGICLMGGPIIRENMNASQIKMALDKGSRNFTMEQWKSLNRVVDAAKKFYPNAKIVGHCDLDPVNKPFCPGFDVRSWAGTFDKYKITKQETVVA